MAREASAAPKERINVTFKPATGGAQEEIELPLKVTVLGDFRHRHDDRHLLDRKPVKVNRNNFADVMAKQDLSMEFAVPRKLKDSDSDVDMQVKLNIGNMRDFEPESIIHQVPELHQLDMLRQALVSLKGPLGNLPAFRKTLEDILKDPRQREAILREVSAQGIDIEPLAESTAKDGNDKGEDKSSGPSSSKQG